MVIEIGNVTVNLLAQFGDSPPTRIGKVLVPVTTAYVGDGRLFVNLSEHVEAAGEILGQIFAAGPVQEVETESVVHAGDMEGSRLCGSSDGLKTVYLPNVTCPDCLSASEARQSPVTTEVLQDGPNKGMTQDQVDEMNAAWADYHKDNPVSPAHTSSRVFKDGFRAAILGPQDGPLR